MANHEALRLAHITAERKDPPAGTIDRDAQEVPTGVLKECAMDAVRNLIPPPTQLFLENKVGSIESGKEADIAVWDKDMYTIPSAELRNLKCEMTIYHGEIVYRTR